ncbi:iron transporter [Halostella sp. PRR32]|uniref:iron transporter n=1 Tax=Halostella sp. PRR32 TaxID=3098147 RepID=UPI002B1E7822|nr:iron transporter [Halostella sp. PRR32]
MSEKTTSDEVDERQLELAKAEGEAYTRALDYMIDEVAETGGLRTVDDYVVGFAQEEAEGMYVPGDDGDLEWTEPEEENCHLEVAVTDAADGRFVPELTVRSTLDPEDGETVGPFEVPFVWHPGLHHYGKNVEVPGDGEYDITVEVDPPAYMRHDQENGDRYAEPVEVTFENVEIETGQD